MYLMNVQLQVGLAGSSSLSSRFWAEGTFKKIRQEAVNRNNSQKLLTRADKSGLHDTRTVVNSVWQGA